MQGGGFAAARRRVIRVEDEVKRRPQGRRTNRRSRDGREELKAQIDELMLQYQDEEIDGETYQRAMMALTTSAQD